MMQKKRKSIFLISLCAENGRLSLGKTVGEENFSRNPKKQQTEEDQQKGKKGGGGGGEKRKGKKKRLKQKMRSRKKKESYDLTVNQPRVQKKERGRRFLFLVQ